MHALTRKVAGLASVALVASGAAGCAADETGETEAIRISNRADADATVQLDGETGDHLAPKDGVTILGGMVECYEGPIVVTYADGGIVELTEPICGGQTLMVRGGTAEVVENADAH